jgi:predicted nucleic acid-binding protein
VRAKDLSAGPALVDTDVATWILLDAPQLKPYMPLLADRILSISFATLGELLALCYRTGSPWGEPRRDRWTELIRQTFVVLPYDARVAEIWAPLHMKLKGHLHGGGANDLWTAAAALAFDPPLPVITHNTKDFNTIAKEASGLRVVHPIKRAVRPRKT